MAFRDSIHRHRRWAALAATLFLAAGVFLIYRQTHTPDERQGEKAFYTTDEGATRFVAPMDYIPPFMHEGRLAVRAWYYTCDGGKTDFLGYLEKYTDDARAELERLKHDPKAQRQAMLEHLGKGALLVKKPGDRWLTFTEDGYAEVINPTCPDGDTQNLRRVVP